jgi:hypothetical protein
MPPLQKSWNTLDFFGSRISCVISGQKFYFCLLPFPGNGLPAIKTTTAPFTKLATFHRTMFALMVLPKLLSTAVFALIITRRLNALEMKAGPWFFRVSRSPGLITVMFTTPSGPFLVLATGLANMIFPCPHCSTLIGIYVERRFAVSLLHNAAVLLSTQVVIAVSARPFINGASKTMPAAPPANWRRLRVMS